MNKIYHYYFNVYNNKKLILRHEEYEYESIVRKNEYLKKPISPDSIIIFCKSEHRKLNLQRDLNKLIAGRSIYMLERNDQLALDIFGKYTAEKLVELQKSLHKLIDIQNFVKSTSFNLEGI